jgi:6-phosphogluconolactonase
LELVACETSEEASRAAAQLLAEAARNGGDIALSGGSTPRRAYQLAAGLQSDWSRAELWWGDERCVPPDDELSNFRLAREALLDRLGATPRAVHRILGELDPHEAARRYGEKLRGVTLDLVLLGLGADGHTASLFPHHEALDEEQRLAVAVERPDVARVTLTPPPLRAAQHVVFLVTGDEKAGAVRRAFREPPDSATPASLIRGLRTTAILDGNAAVDLRRGL